MTDARYYHSDYDTTGWPATRHALSPPPVPRPAPPPERVVAILREVARAHGVSVSDLIGESRRRRISHARQEAMWRLRRLDWRGGVRGRPSIVQIGEWMNRDHSTVSYGVLSSMSAAGTRATTSAAIYQGAA